MQSPGQLKSDLSRDRGNLHEVFPWQDEYAQPARYIRAQRSYDCGVQYCTKVADLDNDGLDEIIIHDRDRVWVYHSPEH